MIRTYKKIKFTKEGYAALESEYLRLQNERPAAVKELTRAREMGDLSENGLYTAAKARLRSMDSAMRRIKNQMKLAEVVNTKKITVEREGAQIDYEIVGDYEADPVNHKISENSPIGNALKNAKEGDTVQIQTPRGTTSLNVVKVLE